MGVIFGPNGMGFRSNFYSNFYQLLCLSPKFKQNRKQLNYLSKLQYFPRRHWTRTTYIIITNHMMDDMIWFTYYGVTSLCDFVVRWVLTSPLLTISSFPNNLFFSPSFRYQFDKPPVFLSMYWQQDNTKAVAIFIGILPFFLLASPAFVLLLSVWEGTKSQPNNF